MWLNFPSGVTASLLVCVCVCARETVLVTCARRRSSDALGFAPSSPPAAAGQISAGEGWLPQVQTREPLAVLFITHCYSYNTIQAPHLLLFCDSFLDFRHFYHITLNYTLHKSLSSPKTTKIRLLLCSYKKQTRYAMKPTQTCQVSVALNLTSRNISWMNSWERSSGWSRRSILETSPVFDGGVFVLSVLRDAMFLIDFRRAQEEAFMWQHKTITATYSNLWQSYFIFTLFLHGCTAPK